MKKILYVCCINPFLTVTGGHQRSYLQVKLFKTFLHVDVLLLANNTDEPISRDDVIQIFANYDGNNKLWDKRLKQFFSLLPLSHFFVCHKEKICQEALTSQLKKNDYDYIFFRYINSYLKCGAPDLPNMIIDIDDLPWQNSECIFSNANNSIAKRLYHKYRAFWCKYFCKRLFERFRVVSFSNEQDMIGQNSAFLPNIPIIQSEQELIINEPNLQEPTILFIGSLSHVPNYEGMNHFIKFIWPKVLNKFPKVRLKIVGRGLPEDLYHAWSGEPNIELWGFVESLSQIYSKSTFVISPIYSGAGTNIKVLEALSYRKPCIISRFSWRGFETELKNGEDLMVCVTDEEYVTKLCEAIDNPESVRRMAEHGHRQVKRYYSEDRVLSVLKSIVG